jgi:pyrroline-5-carboxylate reductase
MLGFVGAGLMGFALLISIWRSGVFKVVGFFRDLGYNCGRGAP